MARAKWAIRNASVGSLLLDSKNPRLGRETQARAPRDIIQYLFENDKAMDVAASIATRGFFPNEPLLAIKENDRYVVIEGNRRLAALKALLEPGLLEGPKQRQVERLSRKFLDLSVIATVPVIIAPDRRSTDRQVAGRHVGTSVLPWEGENRASFILDKLEEGYDNDALRDELGFSLSDIQEARQTRAIADMARSLDLPEEVKAKLDSPRAKVFTTLERVFNSSVGRDLLHVEKDHDHGLKGKTSKQEFLKGFTKLVSDVALNHQSSRTLNTNTDIEKYFKGLDPQHRPQAKRGTFVPSDLITGKSVASAPAKAATSSAKRTKPETKTVLPKDLHVRVRNDRLIDIRRELTILKRDAFPNAGAVLLRVFFELAATSYLERTGIMKRIVEKIGAQTRVTMRHLVPALVEVAKARLTASEANKVEKALRYDQAAPFTLSDMHSFVHQTADLPGARDIWQFWLRTEPLFRLILEKETGETPP